MISLHTISFRYQPTTPWIFKDLSANYQPGSIIGIQGASGSGKTTLLYALCGVIPAMIKGDFTGEVKINKEILTNLTLPQIAPLASLLMQQPDYQLFFPTVEQEIAFGPENLCLAPAEIQARVDSALVRLSIEELRHTTSAHLSFGQKRLVTLAALLALSPQVMLLDEPLGGIHPGLYPLLAKAITQEAQKGKIIFVADHHPALLELADVRLQMEDLR